MKNIFKISAIKKLLLILVFIFMFVVLLLLVKGNYGTGLNDVKNHVSKGMVFESSISRGRYALLLAIAEDKKFEVNKELAFFAKPDIIKINEEKFVSVWPPGVAFYLLPFYVIGKYFNLGEFFSGAGIAFVGIINYILIFKICRILKFSNAVSFISGFLFLFSTNALVFSTIISQHQVTTLLLLLIIYISLNNYNKRSFLLSLSVFIYGLGILVDLPNIVLLSPFVLYEIIRHLVEYEKIDRSITLKIKYWKIIYLAVIIIPLASLLIFNRLSTGNYFTFGQNYSRFKDETKILNEDALASKSLLPFKANIMNKNVSILLFGYERGVAVYSPLFFLSVFGISRLFKKFKVFTVLLSVNILFFIILYSMFSDVWGGWSFGPRYLIPVFAMASITIAQTIDLYARKLFFAIIFSAASVYGILLSVLGSLTTILIPPRREVVGLNIDSSYVSNISFLKENNLNSFYYEIFFKKYFNSIEFYFFISLILVAVFFITYTFILLEKKNT